MAKGKAGVTGTTDGADLVQKLKEKEREKENSSKKQKKEKEKKDKKKRAAEESGDRGNQMDTTTRFVYD